MPAGCGVPRRATAPGKPASQFWQRSRRGWVRGVPRGLGGAGKPASRFWQRVGHGRARGFPQRSQCRKRKGHGDARCAPTRQGWAGAAGAYKKAPQGNLAGGPGVLRTPGRRPPHRNGGTFGSFSHERTTIIRYVDKKKAAKLSRQVSCKATPARPIKKNQRARRGGARGFPAT